MDRMSRASLQMESLKDIKLSSLVFLMQTRITFLSSSTSWLVVENLEAKEPPPLVLGGLA